MSWISAGNTAILLYGGEGGTLALENAPEAYESPLSIEESHAQGDEEGDIDDVDRDDIDSASEDESDFEPTADDGPTTEQGLRT